MNTVETLKRIKEAEKAEIGFLDLRNAGLTTLPPEIGTLTEIRALYLQGNTIEVLPPEIGRLTQLRTLHLESNRIARSTDVLQPG